MLFPGNNEDLNRLEDEAGKATGTEKTEIYYKLVRYYSAFDAEKAMQLASRSLNYANKNKDNKGIAISCMAIGEAYFGLGENIKALNYYLKALKIFEELNDQKWIAVSSDKTGSVYRVLGDFDRALDFHLKSIKLFEKIKDTKGKISSLINAGIVLRNLGQEDKALKYYKEALQLCTDTDDNECSIDVYVALGNLYWYKGDNDKALEYYEKAYEISKNENVIHYNVAGILNNIGNVYREKGEFKTALSYYSRSLAISKKAGDKNMIAVTLKNLGISYLKNGYYNKAIKFLLESKDIAAEINLLRILKEDYEMLSQAYSEKKDYENALKYQMEYSKLKDEIFNRETADKVATLQMEYESKNKEQQKTLKKKEEELDISQSKLKWNLFFIAFLIVLFIAAIIWYRYRLKEKANRELKKLNQELEKRVQERTKRLKEENEHRRIAQEQAELANEAKTRFLATISHEVRTPINAIIGFCDLTISTVTDPEHKINLKRIKDSSVHLLALIKDILDYSQIENGKLQLKNEVFNLKNIITSVINAYYLDAISKKLKLSFDINDNVPVLIKSDPDALRQILYNLIGNALKFTDKGEVRLTVSCPEQMKDKNSVRLLFKVKDTGIGITKLKQKLIFNEFTQADGSMIRKFGGAGLGLTISKRFVEMMGGSISVESEKGKGSTFTFDIIVSLPEKDSKQDKTDGKKDEKKAMNILVAEDNSLNAQVIEAFLKRLGHSSKTVNNGKLAVSALAGENFDAVLMDLEMPEMDGFEATKAIRSGKGFIKNTNIPIIALTAHALKDYEDKCFEIGMNAYLTKPIDIDKLSEILMSL